MSLTLHNNIFLGQLGVSTGSNENDQIVSDAQALALSLNAPYLTRNGRSIEWLFEFGGLHRLLLVRRDCYSLHNLSGISYQFHPNLAIVRGRNYASTGSDHFLEAANLQAGDTVIDCTLGFGSEAILASLVVGPTGEVIGLESVPELAIVTRDGMSRYRLLQKDIESAMRRIVVINCTYVDYLRRRGSHSADVVYFDPFFSEPLEKSSMTISPLAQFGNRSPLDLRGLDEARRVARRSVIVKHPKNEALPSQAADAASHFLSGRKSTVEYVVIPGFGA